MHLPRIALDIEHLIGRTNSGNFFVTGVGTFSPSCVCSDNAATAAQAPYLPQRDGLFTSSLISFSATSGFFQSHSYFVVSRTHSQSPHSASRSTSHKAPPKFYLEGFCNSVNCSLNNLRQSPRSLPLLCHTGIGNVRYHFFGCCPLFTSNFLGSLGFVVL